MADPAVVTVNDVSTGHKVPVYLGGDPPLELNREVDPAARGDLVLDETPADTPAEKPAPEKPAEKEPPAKPEDADPPTSGKEERDRDEQGRFVPKKRFDEVNERRRIAEDKLAQLDREKQAATKAADTEYDFDAKEQAYIELILDGKSKEAAALRSEIRAAEAAQYEKVATTRAAETNRAMTVEHRINGIAAEYEKRLPQFNPEAPEYSEDLLDDVNAFYTGYLQGKKFESPAEAFQAAITKALKAHGIEDLKPEVAAPAATNGTTPPARTAAKRIDAIKNQPPNIARAGNGSAEHGDANIRVAELSEAEFARLPEATRRRLRGDSL